MFDWIDRLADRFIPPSLAVEPGSLSRARSFVFGHLFGIPFGLAGVVLIRLFEGYLSLANGVFLASVFLFASYPLMLRRVSKVDLLGCVSVIHFAAILFFIVHQYGGLQSPVLPWAAAIPVAAVFFLSPRYSVASVGLVLAGMLVLLFMERAGVSFPHPLSANAETTLMWLSVVLLLLYISAMVFVHHRIYFQIQERLGHEIQKQLETERALTHAKEAAETANDSKTRFLAQMSHELRTPLNAIIGFSEMIRSGALDADLVRYREYATDIKGSGQHLLQLVNEIIDLARIEAGKLELTEGWVNVGQIVRETTSMAEAIAHPKKIRVELFEAPGRPWLHADGLRIKQILINLITNAIKFTGPGGRISLHVERARDGGVLFVVNDTGVGISKADRLRVTQPFERGSNAERQNPAGAGLGLPIAIHLAELHGGRITINDRASGGTSVEMWLPPGRVGTAPEGSPAMAGGPNRSPTAP